METEKPEAYAGTVGAAEGCDLLLRTWLCKKTKSKDRSLVALDSSYGVSGLGINPIQCPVYRQFGKHDDLRDGQRRAALRAAELIGEIAGHHVR